MPHASKRVPFAALALDSRRTWEVLAVALALAIMVIPAIPSHQTFTQGFPDPYDRALEEVWSVRSGPDYLSGPVYLSMDEKWIVVTEDGLMAVDLSSGRRSWEVAGFDRLIALSADGYTLAERSRADANAVTQTTYAWISPQGEILWQIEQHFDDYSNPLNQLRLSLPKASASGTIVFPGPDGGLYAVTTEGTIAWSTPSSSVDLPLLAVNLGIKDLPSTLLAGPPIGAADDQSSQFTSYDVVTGSPRVTFELAETKGWSNQSGVDLLLWQDWVVWQTAGVGDAECVLHGRSLVDGAEWRDTAAPCLSRYPFVRNGRIGSSGESIDGSVAQTQMIDIRSGQRADMGTDAWTFGDSASPLSAVGWRGDSVVGFGLDDGSEVWSTSISPNLLSFVGDNGALLAVLQGSSRSGRVVVSTMDAATGQILDTFAMPWFGSKDVAPISANEVLVAGDGRIVLYRAN